MTLVFAALAWRDRRRAGAAAGIGFVARNGWPVAVFLVGAVTLWAVFMIVLPLLAMIDLSFRPKLPPIQWGSPRDLYTLENYRY
ncbi:hypothetical protein J8J40_27410, partial [Mycobacterium tuberculosis]|nr:hypothetical protein [Mycobacterium tuberculosis]